MVLGSSGHSNNSASIQVFSAVETAAPQDGSNTWSLVLNPLGGKVGIGTEPSTALDVNGDASISGTCTATSFSGSLSGNATGLSGSPTVTLSQINRPSGTDGLIIQSANSVNSYFYYTGADDVESIYIRAGKITDSKSRVIINDNGTGDTIIGNNVSYDTRIRTNCIINGTCSANSFSGSLSGNAISVKS